ncbi:unnamed protein product (macronuclear) [Paramecium tetraurelia]|uniref:DUF4378 domain-containing protein n=1 Tax=Paramecium tetraurelia TaxID=5888 RepID=A0DGH0_PARTE|nr:uncharacterized protein GSPATT00002266001 [Paramecium tetraurelia]CAK82137.1 unnamed protein product [Paramecium tetraurelia]|eukprot:XP_001449534.1 hypothetical protein (macronuclear) [Paramecium tetraurelia strain d4-2]
MQCRKVEPNVIMNSARLMQRPIETNKLEEEIVNVMKSPEKKSPHNGKCLKRTTSGPIINLQQQIIIQQGEPIKDTQVELKSKSQIKKKKKKKKTQKKKKVQLQDKQESEQRVQQLLKSNLRKHQKDKQEQQVQEEIQKQRVASLNEMRKIMDQQIRQVNQQRFSRQKSPPSSVLPWGIDQNKLKQYWTKMLEIHDKLEKPIVQSKTSTEQAIKEKIRRHKLGLDFLNSKPEKDIQKMIQKQKSKQVLESISSPLKNKNNCEHKEVEQDVKLYMMYKKELWRQQKIEEKQLQKLKKEKVLQNLQILNQEAKQFAKSRNASIKSNLTVQLNSQHVEPQSQHYRTSEPPNFNKLEKEYKELMRSLRQSSYSSTQSHTRKNSQLTFIEWLSNLPESYLQEQLMQMQVINEQMNSQGFQYKLSEQELYQFLEQFLKEKFEQQSKQTIKERFQELQGRFQLVTNQQQSQSQQQQYQQYQQQQSLSQQQNYTHHSISSSKSKKQIQEQPDTALQDELFDKISEEQLELIQNIAATMIQKVWRGFKTRQLEEAQKQDKGVNNSEQVLFRDLLKQDDQQSINQATESNRKQNNYEYLQNDSAISHQQGYAPPPSESIQQSSPHQSSPKGNNNIPHLNLDQFSQQQLSSAQKSIKNNQNLPQSQSACQSQSENLESEIEQIQDSTPKKSRLNQNGSNQDPDYYIQVLKSREEALQQKFDKQVALLDKMLEKKKVTNEMFSENKDKLERKYKRERAKLQQSKNEVERLQQMFKETIKSTQKDQQFMEKIKMQCDEENLSIRQIFSLRSETEQSDCDIEKKAIPHYGLLQKIKNDHFRKYQKNRKQVRSFDQQMSLDEISMKNEEIQTSTLFNIHTESMSHSIHKSQQITSNNQKSIPSQEIAQVEAIEILENRDPQPNYRKSIIPFDDRKIDSVTENIVQNIIVEFAEELNNFPLQSLGVLMEWDEESQIEYQFPPGFPTTLNFIKDYLVSFGEFIQKHHLSAFIQQINTPLGISPQDLLKTISLSDMQQNNLDDSTSGPLYPLIKYIHQMEPLIDEDIWSKFNQSYSLKLKYFNDLNISDQFKELEMFHLRMVYEAFNEAINFVRPYGIRGQPYPWKSNPLKVYQNLTTPETIDRAMGFAIAKMLKWGSFLCGFIPEKIETPQGEIIVIEDDYLNQIKEDRLQQMLEYEIQESEEKWLNYDEEQAEVAVELADIVFEAMLDEVAEEIFRASSRQAISKKQFQY